MHDEKRCNVMFVYLNMAMSYTNTVFLIIHYDFSAMTAEKHRMVDKRAAPRGENLLLFQNDRGKLLLVGNESQFMKLSTAKMTGNQRLLAKRTVHSSTS